MSETCRVIYDNKSSLLHQVGTSRHFHIWCTVTHTSNTNRNFMSRSLFLGYFTHVGNKWCRNSTYRNTKLWEIHKSFWSLLYSNALPNVSRIASNSTCINISYLEKIIPIVAISCMCALSKTLNVQTHSSPLLSWCPLDLHSKTDCGKLRTEQTRYVL